MNRRKFLKLSAAFVGVLAVPFPIGSKAQEWLADKEQRLRWAAFDPHKEYGRAFSITTKDYELIANGESPKVLDIAHKQARRIFPPGTPYQIRMAQPMDFGRNNAIAIYYEPLMQMVHPVLHTPKRIGWDNRLGIHLVWEGKA